MDSLSLKPHVLFIGYNHLKNKIYTHFFHKASEIQLTYQDYNRNIWSIFKNQQIDILILQTGHFEGVCKILLTKLRYFYPHIGSMLLLEQDVEKHRILALEMGVDSCLNTTMSAEELQAEICALYRRLQFMQEPQLQIYHFQDYTVDLDSREICDSEGNLIEGLTSGDFLLLKTFLEHPNRLLTRDFLLRKVSNYNDSSSSRSIDIRVSRLRKKLKQSTLIETVHGEGYIFKYVN